MTSVVNLFGCGWLGTTISFLSTAILRRVPAVPYLKAVGWNPLRFGLRVQQLVQFYGTFRSAHIGKNRITRNTIVIPITTETRRSKVIFPNYSKKKTAEDTLVPPLWGTRGKNVRFSRIVCSRCCTRRNLRFHVENSQHADQKQLTRR